MNPGRRMRESELLFQVILTQVACTRQPVGEEGRGSKSTTTGCCGKQHAAPGGRAGGMAVVCVLVRERGESPHLPGRKSGGQPGRRCTSSQCCEATGPPSKEAACRRVKMYVRKALHIFQSGKRTNGIPQIVAGRIRSPPPSKGSSN